MDPKRKKIYIVVIAVCLLSSVGVLYWGGFFGGGSAVPINEVIVTTPEVSSGESNTNTTFRPLFSVENGFPAPPVFPADDTFDTKVLDSDAYKRLKTYQPVDINGKLGRPDPFNRY